MKLSSTHLRYLLAIYHLATTNLDVSSMEVANLLGVKRASVSRMMPLLMEKGLVVKKKYSKLYLTDVGFLTAKRLTKQVEMLEDVIKLRLHQPDENAWKSACAAVCELPVEIAMPTIYENA
jgi:DtxR family Mn-dependent transcriptional regulator